ncbi:hypothetical protein EMCRGX_G019860 [Ephydatia muelleri]
MDGLRSLLACAVLALLSSSSFAATGLQVYYYRNSSVNPQQMWRVEGIATLFKTATYVAYLLCNTTSNNGSGIVWMRGQVTVNSSLTEKLATNGVLLLINGFTTNDLGVYTCFDSLSNSYLTINVTTANPAIQAVSDVVTIEAGSSGQLKVYISGVPNPTSTDITWFKVGPGGIKTELKEPTVNFSSDHHTLLLNNIEPEDGGIYQCIVSQSFLLYRSANVYINVTVLLFPAIITQQPSNLSLVQSANATLSCSATGSPAPNLTWRRTGGSGLPYSATIVTYGNSTTTTSTLSIVNTQPQDGSQYQCQAIVPGTTPVWSQPAFIQVLQQATPQWGGAVLIIIGAVLLVYVCVYFRYCKPHKGVATWPKNGTRTKSSINVLFDRTGNGDQSHILFKQTPSTADGEVLYDRYLTDVPTPSHPNAVLKDPIYSPLSASEVPKTCHEYTGIVGSSVPADYNRFQRDSLKGNLSSNTTGKNAAHLQILGEITSGEVQQYALSEHNNRNTSDGNGGDDGSAGDGSVTTGNSNSKSAVFQSPPPVQLLSQTAGKIPIRRHGLNTPAVVPEGPASLYSSAISALSSVPASSLSITSPSNVFVGPTAVEKAPVTPRVGEKSGSSVLSSVPEHAVSVHRPYENVVIPASTVTRYQVPTPTPNGTEAPQVPSPTPNGTKVTVIAVGPPPGYEDVTTEQPWYELAEETDSDVTVPVAASTVQRVQTLPHHTSRSGQHHGAHAHNSAAQNVGPHRPIAYRGSLSRAPPPRTEAKREVYFSASSLSCETTV